MRSYYIVKCNPFSRDMLREHLFCEKYTVTKFGLMISKHSCASLIMELTQMLPVEPELHSSLFCLRCEMLHPYQSASSLRTLLYIMP
jgi:hypothetical protein